MNQIIYAVQIFDKASKTGLHIRPASLIRAALADAKFSNTTIEAFKLDNDFDVTKTPTISGTETKVNVKSVMSFLTLGVKHEEKICFIIKGDQAEAALATLMQTLYENGLAILREDEITKFKIKT